MTKMVLDKLVTVTCILCGAELYAEKDGDKLKVNVCIACNRKFIQAREVIGDIKIIQIDLAEAEQRIVAHLIKNPEMKEFLTDLITKEKKHD